MVVCKNCAGQSPDGVLYCTKCGARIAPYSEDETKAYIAGLQPDAHEAEPKESIPQQDHSRTIAPTAICSNCGYQGKPVTSHKGKFWIEVVLFIPFIVPGLIYSLWRLTTREQVCPKCKQPHMIPLDTPRGRKLAGEGSEQQGRGTVDVGGAKPEEVSMGILDRLSGKAKPKYENLGSTEAVCPYCAKTLHKMPGRKTKCPFCANFMYVRTRPSDKKRVVATEQDATKIDEQWMVENGTYQAHLETKAEFAAGKAALAQKFGREPSDNDVMWSLHNKHSLEQAKQGDWGLYRNTRLSMAEQMRREGKQRPALNMYLEVSYLDANGPNNLGGISNYPALLKEYPPFSRANALQAPWVVGYIAGLVDGLDMSQTDLKEAFMTVASRLYTNMRLPTSPEEGWQDLVSELPKTGEERT